MNNLVKKELTLDSREVAEMVGKRHDHLIRDIETYIQYLDNPDLGNGSKPIVADFFMENNYKSGTPSRNYKRYDCTKKGCEFIAHKLTGQKGAVFTATYINKFHEMESIITGQNIKLDSFQAMKLINQQVGMMLETVEEIDERVGHLENNMTVDFGQQNTLQNKAKSRAVNILGGVKSHAYQNKSLRSRIFSSMWKDYKDYFEISSYKDTARIDFEKALNYLENWQVQGKLLREIEDCNNQLEIKEAI